MAKFTDVWRNTLSNYFNAGDQPTEGQFAQLMLSIQEGIEEHDHGGGGDGDGTQTLLGPITLENAAVSTVAAFQGLKVEYTKTAGVTDHVDTMHGLYSRMIVDQVGGVVGHLYGADIRCVLEDGDIGTIADPRNAYGILGVTDLEGGVVRGDAFGMRFSVDQEAANTIAGDATVQWLRADFDGVVTGTVYMLYLDENTGVDFGIYQDGTADNRLGGNLGIGMNPTANGLLCMTTPTENTEFIDAGSAGASEQDWIEVEIGGVQGYIRVFAAK